MLTQCPNCQTIYQISAGELGAAKGVVECGECGVQFNALDRIADEPQFDNQQAEATNAEAQDTKSTPAFVLMEEGESGHSESVEETTAPVSPELTESAAEAPASTKLDEVSETVDVIEPEHSIPATEEHDKTLELAVLSDEQNSEESLDESRAVDKSPNGQTKSDDTESMPKVPVFELGADNSPASLPPEEHDILFSDPIADSPVQQAVPMEDLSEEKVPAEANIDLDEVPPILQEELLAMQKPKSTGANLFWLVCAMVLFVGISVQAAWHYRHPLLDRFPTAVPYAEQACTIVGCELKHEQALEPIQLVSRDVRTHPRYENALLVNASMVNSSAETISFPTVQLGLFDPTGTAIGIRQFSPTEYLDKSIEIDSGIPPGRSVHVVLELANTGDVATSFEFSFH